MIEYNGRKISLIGEVKTRTASGSFHSPYSWDYLFQLANENFYVDMISILINKEWDGSLDLLRKARLLTEKPILAKGKHMTNPEILHSFEAGCDRALVIGRVPMPPGISGLQNFCYLEPYNLSQLQEWKNLPKGRISGVVWNTRDITNLSIERYKTETFEQARTIWNGNNNYLIQASNIRKKEDIHPEADGVLVGSYLPEFLKSLE